MASPTKSTWQIVRENTFTFFNLVFVVLAACLWSVGSFANMGFLGVAICNTVIGVVQQLRSKYAVDRLTLVAAHRVRCLRDGQFQELPASQLVRDDIVEFSRRGADLRRRGGARRRGPGQRGSGHRRGRTGAQAAGGTGCGRAASSPPAGCGPS